MTNFADADIPPSAQPLSDVMRDSSAGIDPAPKPNRSGGPATAEGKATSSMNALTHGLRSQKLVLRHEDPLEFEATMRGWFEHYEPATPVAISLVEQTAKAHWFLKRAEKHLENVEWELPGNAYLWTEDHERKFRNFNRYKTAAERSFFRFFDALEKHYDRNRRNDLQKEEARIAASRVDLGWARFRELQARDSDEIEKVQQHIEVQNKEDICITTCAPSNEELATQLAARPEPPVAVIRLIHFIDGVPSEYKWADPTPYQVTHETRAKQILPYASWLRVVEEEAGSATGHLAASGRLQFNTR